LRPFSRSGKPFGAVAVTVSFDPLLRLRNTGRVIAAWSTVLSIVSPFVLVELLTRWFIHGPSTRSAMPSARWLPARSSPRARAAPGRDRRCGNRAGPHARRAPGASRDAAVAGGPGNRRTTQRNRDLPDLYQQMFRLREELGRSQQLAAVGETTSAVAHQIGTPLNLVSGHIQQLLNNRNPARQLRRGCASPTAAPTSASRSQTPASASPRRSAAACSGGGSPRKNPGAAPASG